MFLIALGLIVGCLIGIGWKLSSIHETLVFTRDDAQKYAQSRDILLTGQLKLLAEQNRILKNMNTTTEVIVKGLRQ